MKTTERLLDEIPIERREFVLNKMTIFEKLLLESKALISIPKGFWIRNIKGTEIYKFRINNGDRILFKYRNSANKNEIIFISYCKHDKQVNVAKNYNNGSLILDLEIDKEIYVEDELDEKINNSINDEICSKLKIIENELIIEDEYISLSIEENNKQEMKYLSKEQYKCLINVDKPILILGCAGSGKSMIALRRLILNNEINIKTAYITCSKMIVDDIQNLYSTFMNDKEYIDFYTFSDLCKQIIGFDEEEVINYFDFCTWINNYTLFNKNCEDLRLKEIWIEINTIIKGNYDILSLKDYINYNKSHYTDKEKNIVYKIFIEYEGWLKRNNYYDTNDLARLALQNPNSDGVFEYIILDEVQEITHIQSMLINKLIGNINNIMLLGDLNQNINIEKLDLKFIKESIFKKGSYLKEQFINKNYRNVSETVNWLNKLIEIKNSAFSSMGKMFEEPETSVRNGDKPRIIYNLENESDFFRKIDNDTDSIVIVCEEEDKEILKLKGYPMGRIFSIEEVRGLEYNNIYCYNLMYKFREIWEQVLMKKSKSEEIYKVYFNMLYIAATRSKKTICFIEKDSTKIAERLDGLWNKIYHDASLLNEIREVEDINKWIKEARALEKSEKYYQASKAYKKANMLKEAELCLKAMERKISYSNNKEKASYILIQSKQLSVKEIEKSLLELENLYNINIYGYIDILVWYDDLEGFRGETIFIYDSKSYDENAQKIYNTINKKYFNKSKIVIKAYFYHSKKDLSSNQSIENKDIIFNFNSEKMSSHFFSYWEMRKINGVMNYLEDENNKMLGFNPVNQMRILKNKEKYNEKNANDILDFIFKSDK